MKKLVVYAILSIVLIASLTPVTAHSKNQVVVVVTFSYLAPDVERLLCNGVVYAIVPAGVDPHEYQLKPSDIDVLKKADIIISTAHTHFELDIRDHVENGELNAELVEVTEINGLEIKTNPSTKQLNYHMPINDPLNYLLLLEEITRKLASLDPENKACYYEKYVETASIIVREVLVHKGKYSGKVVVDKPHAQYLVEWLGLQVVQVLKAEEEYQVTPGDIEKIQELARSGELIGVVVTEPSVDPVAYKLLEIASQYNVTVLRVNSPSKTSGILENLEKLVSQLNQLENREFKSKVESSTNKLLSIGEIIGLSILAIGIGFTIGYLYTSRKQRKSGEVY